jgi:sulfate/thiosulfate transport system permease protein
MAFRRSNVLPGFGLTLGYTLMYLGLIVLIPLGAMLVRVTAMSPAEFWKVAFSPRALAAYRLTFGASFVAAAFNAVAGLLLAWVLSRYRFPGRRLVDALVDFPFALPTAVAGLTLADLFSEPGWLGRFLVPLGIKVAYTPLGIVVALTFVSLPFVVRTLQPVLEELDPEIEEAAATLGAGRLRTFVAVIFPGILPALLTGFALAFARAIGEYGSVIFISSNRQYESEITPLIIMGWLDQFEYANAIAVAVVMLAISFAILVTINLLERWAGRFQR